MKSFIRIESFESTFFSRITHSRDEIERNLNILTENGQYGGASIQDSFLTVVRIYPENDFKTHESYYKPVAKKGRKENKTVLITQDIYAEELEGKNDIYIYNRLIDCVVASVKKLEDLKIKDVDIEKLVDTINGLRKEK